jgi:hypothetical protein
MPEGAPHANLADNLTDDQLNAILAASHPLAPHRRSAFLADVARELAQLEDIGDGILHRTIMVVQKRHLDPPQFEYGDGGVSKYDRLLRRRTRTA